MIFEQTFMKLGYTNKDIRFYLDKIMLCNNNIKTKETHIDVYPENPFASSSCFSLILRAHEKNAMISIEGDRIIFKKDDKYKTHFINILSSKVTECFSKQIDNCYELVLNVQNIYYKITIYN